MLESSGKYAAFVKDGMNKETLSTALGTADIQELINSGANVEFQRCGLYLKANELYLECCQPVVSVTSKHRILGFTPSTKDIERRFKPGRKVWYEGDNLFAVYEGPQGDNSLGAWYENGAEPRRGTVYAILRPWVSYCGTDRSGTVNKHLIRVQGFSECRAYMGLNRGFWVSWTQLRMLATCFRKANFRLDETWHQVLPHYPSDTILREWPQQFYE